MLDVLIRGGWVADGTGNPRYPADVAVEGERIVDVGRLDGAVAKEVIDTAGKIICPGFVDAHSHSDWSLFANPSAESTIRQGVTTEVVGNCGESFAPFTELARAHLTDRKNFLEISELMGQDPWDCYFDIMAAAGRGLNSLIMVGRLFTEEHMAEMITHPLFNLAVDIWSTRTDGPLSERTRHSLYFSGHITYLTHYVRELGLLRLEDVIRKMTSMPATHFGLRDRGLVRKGGFADVVVFDYEKLAGASTVDQPLAYARGVEHVLVNGTPVVANGEHTGSRPGRNLLRI